MRTIRLSLMLSCLALAAVGCGGDRLYADDFSAEIGRDCEETISCRHVRGLALSAMPHELCVERTRDVLNSSSEAERAIFEEMARTCAGLTSCAYYDCTQAETRYSDTQAIAIRHECTQNIECRVTRGEDLPATAIDACVAHAAVSLDMSDEAVRASFEGRYQRCAQQTDCAYSMCQ